jgi:GT2 family glycosyltransferase
MKTAIILLNWNGGLDTIACLDSMLGKIDLSQDKIFIIDNDSSDQSIQLISDFIVQKEISFSICDAAELNNRYNKETAIFIVKNKANLGFGAGNNTVLKKLKSLNDNFQCAWLINNDAIVEQESLSSLKLTMASSAEIAAVGSIILNYPIDGIIQNTGVKYYPYLGVSKLINKNKNLSEIDFSEEIKFDYLNGASLLLRLSALENSGYFDERFFLYSEEHDLQVSLLKNKYQLVLEPKSKVYHQLMGSTKNASHLFYFHYSKSAMQFTKKHASKMILVISFINLTIISFIRTFPNLKNFKWALKGILTGTFK